MTALKSFLCHYFKSAKFTLLGLEECRGSLSNLHEETNSDSVRKRPVHGEPPESRVYRKQCIFCQKEQYMYMYLLQSHARGNFNPGYTASSRNS